MKILFTPYGGGSIAHIIRSLAVADVLKARGHTILFTSPTVKKHLIEKAGYAVYGSGHPEVNLNDADDQSINYFRKNRSLFIAWLSDELEAARSFQPDIIVNSPNFFGTPAGSKLGIPYISIINAQWLMEFKGLLGLGKSRDFPHHAMLRKAAKPVFAHKFDQQYMQEISSFYEELDIPRIPRHRIELHSQNPALIPSIPAFEPIERTPRLDLHYVGPLFWQGFEQEPFHPDTLFSHFDNKPFVYVSLGGSIYRKKTYDDLIQALSAHSDWNILLALGPNFPRSEFPNDSSHFAIRTFTPGLKICQYADVVVNTASHGTVMQALWYGKPLVTLPHNIDQGTIAARLVELGLGINLNKVGIRDFSQREKYFEKATQVTWKHIIEATESVIHNQKMRQVAERFKHKLHAYDHADQRAADYVEQYAQRT